jgi:nucleotide-binding universal stress UspA family protein
VEGTIVVGVDESTYARAAMRWAVGHAAVHHAHVHAVMAWGFIDQHHLEPDAAIDPHYDATVATKVLTDLVARAVGADQSIRTTAVNDLPARALLETAAADDAELLVVGARGMGGFKALTLGSVSRQVLHGARCPVAVIRDDATRTGEPIVVGIDGSAHARRALAWAVEHARLAQLPVVALYAFQLPYSPTGLYLPAPDIGELGADGERFLAQQLEGIDTTGLVVPIESRAVADRAGAALVDASSVASLVVVGSRGHGRLASTVLGSVSDQVSHHAMCPVVVVP